MNSELSFFNRNLDPDLELDLEAPEYFTIGAKKEWDDYLKRGKVKNYPTLKTLEVYCFYYDQWKEAVKKINDIGIIVKNPNGTPIKNPFISISEEAYKKWINAAKGLEIIKTK